MTKASQVLIEIAKREEPNACGVSLEAAGRIPLDDHVTDNLLRCLYDLDSSENAWGLWFCSGLLAARRTDATVERALIEGLPSFVESLHNDLRVAAVLVLVPFRGSLPEYRRWMLQLLNDAYHDVRRIALVNCSTFLKRGEVEPLVKFKDDKHFVEVRMAGPLVYSLRDEALSQIERILGRKFAEARLFEDTRNGLVVTWRDWRPFLQWWNTPFRRWRRMLIQQ